MRITLKKAYRDGTVAVDMDPLSLLCRLATSVPPPRFHTIHYAGVPRGFALLAAASPWRSRVTPPLAPTAENVEPEKRVRKSGYRPWALKHAFVEGQSGEVRVILKQDSDGVVRLQVTDTGVGLPADFEARRGRSLGLQLISDLVRQLGGRLEIDPGPGAGFTVVFTAHTPHATGPIFAPRKGI